MKSQVGHIRAICAFLGCPIDQITKHTTNLYTWEGIGYEVVTRHTKTAPDPYYIKLTMGRQVWYIRELGSRSKLIERIKDVA